jgi:hypothetical protein
MQRARLTLVLFLAATGILAAGTRADAEFKVIVTSGAKSQTYLTSGDPTNINFDSTGFFDDFDITGSGITSNRTVPGQFAANLTLTGDVVRTTAGATDKTLTIEVIDTGFTFPAPPSYTMTGSANGSFTNTGGNDGINFQMYADTTDAPGGMNVLGGSVNLVDSTGIPNTGGNTSLDGIATPTEYSSPIPYSLYTVTTITLGGSIPTSGTFREINFNNSMLVAVPEPASLAMVAIGGMLCAGSLAARRKLRRV